MKIYGYARISRRTQNIDRQERNIITAYPTADIRKEAYTGRKMNGREELDKLVEEAQAGDLIVFDSVSRMSRNADEGIQLYMSLYERGIDLVFLKEPHINTSTYKEALKQEIEQTGNQIADMYIETTNRVLKLLAEKQIRIAFEQAEKEVTDLQQRTKEGLETAKRNGKQIGQLKGSTLNVKKKEPSKQEIRKKSRDFEGTYTDKDLIKVLGIARNTYYKYKKELAEELNAN